MSIKRLTYQDKEIILVGTAHVSRQSVAEVKEVIETEKPDSVCIELCASRYESILDRDRWRKMDIVKVIKENKAVLLLVNLALSTFQGKLAQQFGINPGQEMLQGITSAQESGAELVLADRDIQTTFMRIWRSLGFLAKFKLIWLILLSVFNDEELSEEDLEKLKSEDILMLALQDFSGTFPELKKVLIDERDMYLSQKIKEASGTKIVAIVGAGHLPGILQQISVQQDLQELATLPPKSKMGTFFTWAIPVLILGLIILTFSNDSSLGMKQIGTWVLWTGSLAALGTIIAMGHPISVLIAFVTAPFTALHPLLAVGWFAGLSEAYIRRPTVEDLENLPRDIFTLRGFWHNKVTHLLLVVAIANLGASLGTFIGGIDILKNFLKSIG